MIMLFCEMKIVGKLSNKKFSCRVKIWIVYSHKTPERFVVGTFDMFLECEILRKFSFDQNFLTTTGEDFPSLYLAKICGSLSNEIFGDFFMLWK